MRAAFARRVEAFWARRRPEPVVEEILHRRRVYILPTRSGLIFGLVLVAMLLGAMNYQSSLAYALTFLLASLGVVAILHTYRNLVGLRVKSGQCRPVFVGDTAVFPVAVTNPDADARLALSFVPERGVPVIVDLASHATLWVDLRKITQQRGQLPLGRVTVSTQFPLGLWRAWSYLHLHQTCLIYPRPESQAPLPPAVGGADGDGSGNEGADDFAGLRSYRPGDPLRMVHWKALAREQGLLARQFSGAADGGELWLDYFVLKGLDAEARIARLCRWVLDADEAGLCYGLALPGRQIARGRGPRHRHLCLEALALFGGEDVPRSA